MNQENLKCLWQMELECSKKVKIQLNGFMLVPEKIQQITAQEEWKPTMLMLLKRGLKGVVLVHDTRSNDSQSNDARFMHKLCKHAYFIER